MSPLFAGWWHRAFRRLGPGGVAGVLGLVGALLLVVWLHRLDQDAAALDAVRGQHATRLARPAAPPEAPRVTVEQQIATFVQTFPPLSQHAADLRRVFESAHQRGLLLPRGEYQLRDEAGTPLVTVTATFPVAANYGALRDFSADVLKTLPHAALDELRMSRDGAGGVVLESSVRLSFVYRRP